RLRSSAAATCSQFEPDGRKCLNADLLRQPYLLKQPWPSHAPAGAAVTASAFPTAMKAIGHPTYCPSPWRSSIWSGVLDGILDKQAAWPRGSEHGVYKLARHRGHDQPDHAARRDRGGDPIAAGGHRVHSGV